MDELWSDIRGMGRWGGVVLLLASAGLFGFFYYQYTYMDWFFTLFPALGLTLAVAGLVLFVAGGDKRVKRAKPMPTPELIAQMGHRPRPFFVCTECRNFVDGPYCAGCTSEASVLEIGDDEDARLAAAALD